MYYLLLNNFVWGGGATAPPAATLPTHRFLCLWYKSCGKVIRNCGHAVKLRQSAKQVPATSNQRMIEHIRAVTVQWRLCSSSSRFAWLSRPYTCHCRVAAEPRVRRPPQRSWRELTFVHGQMTPPAKSNHIPTHLPEHVGGHVRGPALLVKCAEMRTADIIH